MEQIVTVRQVHPDGTAEIACKRVSACTGACAECGGCSEGQPQQVLARAANPIGAKPGDLVVVQSKSADVLGAAVAVYLLPLGLLFAGWFLAGGLGGVAGFALGLGLAVLADRRLARRDRTIYTISAFANEYKA